MSISQFRFFMFEFFFSLCVYLRTNRIASAIFAYYVLIFFKNQFRLKSVFDNKTKYSFMEHPQRNISMYYNHSNPMIFSTRNSMLRIGSTIKRLKKSMNLKFKIDFQFFFLHGKEKKLLPYDIPNNFTTGANILAFLHPLKLSSKLGILPKYCD